MNKKKIDVDPNPMVPSEFFVLLFLSSKKRWGYLKLFTKIIAQLTGISIKK